MESPAYIWHIVVGCRLGSDKSNKICATGDGKKQCGQDPDAGGGTPEGFYAGFYAIFVVRLLPK